MSVKKTARRSGRDEKPAKGERLISGSLFLITVATIVGFFIQEFADKV